MSAPAARVSSKGIDVGVVARLDLVLLAVPLALSGLGFVMIYASTKTRLGQAGLNQLSYVEKQGIAAVLGLVVMVAAIAIDYRRLRDVWPLVYIAWLPVLLAVLAIGQRRNGTQAWFQVGPMQFEPSEITKIVVIVAIAGYCHQHRGDMTPWRLGSAVALAAVPIGLVLAQNDLGSAIVILVCASASLVVAGIKVQHAAVLILVGLSVVGAAFATGTVKAYRIDRLTTFLDQESAATLPAAKQTQAEYTLTQAQIAIASGGFTGAGLFHGMRTNLGDVPEQHTDFIFTAVAEQLGFIGGATVIALYGLLVWRLWRIALTAADLFGLLLAIGILAMFTIHVFENIGMTMGIMPITGIPLPFLSYGGSSLIGSFLGIGVAANVHMRRFS